MARNYLQDFDPLVLKIILLYFHRTNTTKSYFNSLFYLYIGGVKIYSPSWTQIGWEWVIHNTSNTCHHIKYTSSIGSIKLSTKTIEICRKILRRDKPTCNNNIIQFNGLNHKDFLSWENLTKLPSN